MDPLPHLLDQRLVGRVAFVGIGNPDLGDDAAGLHLAARLSRSLPPPHAVYSGGTTPERCVRALREERFSTVVLLDAAEFNAPPGTVAWFESQEFQSRFPAVSTHKIPLALLARLIAEGSSCRISLLGIQPGSLRPGSGLSPVVATTVECLEALVLDELQDRWTPSTAESRSPGSPTSKPRELECR